MAVEALGAEFQREGVSTVPKVYLTEAQRREAAIQEASKILATRLRIYRATERLSQQECADKVGISRTWLSGMEHNNLGQLSYSLLFRIVRETKMPLEEWIKLGGYKIDKPQ